MNTTDLKRLSLTIMIASLIAAAVLAVIAVLMGSFGEVFVRALCTLGLVALHSLISLGFIDQTQKKSSSDLPIFNNTIFVIIVLSFFTSIFGVWQIIDGEIVGKLYLTYLILVFASLHGEVLAQTLGKDKTINNIVFANYIFMALVVCLLLPLIWVSNIVDFGDFYFRLLAASGIVDATLTILAVILHRLYMQKHPEEKSEIYKIVTQLDENGQPVQIREEIKPSRRLHPIMWVLIILLGGQFLLGIIFAVIGAIL